MTCAIEVEVFGRTYNLGSCLFRFDYTSRNSLVVGPSNSQVGKIRRSRPLVVVNTGPEVVLRTL